MDTNVNQAITHAKTHHRLAASKGANGGKELGKQDFLNLLMTQMANQDPLNPMDSENMMQQLAAMGTVEQLQNLNAQMEDLKSIQQSISLASSGALLDKDVELATRNLNLVGGNAPPITYTLEGDADQVLVQIVNEAGETVRVVKEGTKGPGMHRYSWDGMDNDGDPMQDGKYRFNVIAKTGEGEDVGVALSKKGRVSMIQFNDGSPLVQINGEWLPATKIKGLGNFSERRFDQANPLPIQTELRTRKIPTLPKAPMTK